MDQTLISFVMDKSGSMMPLASSTIEGFNRFLEEQRGIPGGRMSLTLFDTDFEVRYVARPLDRVPLLAAGGENPYRPGGMTALLDAVGTTIKGTEEWLRTHPGFSGRVLVAVWTDGQENSSREWHINIPMTDGDDRDLNGLIAWKQREGWEFVFLGAGGTDWLEETFGSVVERDRFFGYDHTPAASRATYDRLSAGTSRSRKTGQRWTIDRPGEGAGDDLV
jgi:hypothetical protein